MPGPMTPQIAVWLDGAQLNEFLDRMKTVLAPGDCEMVKGLADTIRVLLGALQDAKTSIRHLREMVFGSKTEKTSEILKDSREEQGGDGPLDSLALPLRSRPPLGRQPESPQR